MPAPRQAFLTSLSTIAFVTACVGEPEFKATADAGARDPGTQVDASVDTGSPFDPGSDPLPNDQGPATDRGPDASVCGKGDPTVGPEMPELCDGKDNNCDGLTDEGFAWNGIKLGADCDGTGACGVGKVECNIDGTAATCSTNPDGSDSHAIDELCDAIDNDCDGQVNEGLTSVEDSTCITAGVCASGVQASCRQDGSGLWNCDYSNVPDYEAGVEKSCDGKDNDCDGTVDEELVDPLGSYCKNKGQCALPDSVVTAACVSGGAGEWDCDYSAVFAYEGDSELSCDGLDNDCDGYSDEDFKVGTGCDGDDPDECENGVIICNEAGDGIECDESGADDSTEKCDGADNDCDGETDEDFADQLGEACDGPDSDECKNGSYQCSPSGLGVTCLEEAVTNTAEICDGDDNDCDGDTDEGFPLVGQPCDGPDADECANGTNTCTASGTAVECINDTAGAIAEACNGLDDDCDGVTDEDFKPGGSITFDGGPYAPDGGKSLGDSCGTGACWGGTVVCSGDGLALTCDTLGTDVTAETCNELDDDCNGTIDDQYQPGGSITYLGGNYPLGDAGKGLGEPCGTGICHSGVVVCEGADTLTCSTAYKADDEICNSYDDDCDGTTDEQFYDGSITYLGGNYPSVDAGKVLDEACGTGACAGGVVVCTADGAGLDCDTSFNQSAEQCNELDDDCNGITDDPWITGGDSPLPDPLAIADNNRFKGDDCGVGACAPGGTPGVVHCKSDGSALQCTTYSNYAAESCDGMDNDCDGATDCDDDECALLPACVAAGDVCAAPALIDALPYTVSALNTLDFNDDYGYSAGACPGEGSGWGGGDGGGAPDIAFAFTPAADDAHVIALQPDAPFDSNLYVVTDCADVDGSCLAADDTGGDESLTLALTGGQTYYVIVDGWSNTNPSNGGTFTLTVDVATENDCGDAVDNDLDGNTDCGDGACTADSDCIAEICDNAPIDDDGDGATDCDDDECAAFLACLAAGDACSTAIPITPAELPYTGSYDTTDVNNFYGYSAGACPGETSAWGNGSPEMVFSFTPTTAGAYVITLDASFDSNLYVATDCADIDGTCLAADETFGVETVSPQLTDGTTYYIFVDGWGNTSSQSGTFDLSVEFDPCNPNPCTTQPADACVGETVTTYDAVGTCTDNAGTAECDYGVATTDNCAAQGLVCNAITASCGYASPGPDDLVITEVMSNPTGVDDGLEWFEVYNATGQTLDLQGLAVANGTGGFTVTGEVLVTAGSYAVLGQAADLGGGGTADYVYAGMDLDDAGESLTLTAGVDTVDAVTFGAATEGASTQLDPDYTNPFSNDVAAYWCDATAAWGGGDLGSPGAINEHCGAATYTIGWCKVLGPASSTTEHAGSSLMVYARLWVNGLTNIDQISVDPAPEVVAQVGYGPDTGIPDGTWTWFPAAGNPLWDGAAVGEGNNDEYRGALTVPAAGEYDYAYRFSGDNGATWSYCDLDDTTWNNAPGLTSWDAYPSGAIVVSIPDGNVGGTTAVINVPDSYSVAGVTVEVDISHTFIGDLTVELISPLGTVVRLQNGSGGGGDDIVKHYGAGDNVDGPGLLADFIGEPVNGDWTLFMADDATPDAGTLNSWTLHIVE